MTEEKNGIIEDTGVYKVTYKYQVGGEENQVGKREEGKGREKGRKKGRRREKGREKGKPYQLETCLLSTTS